MESIKYLIDITSIILEVTGILVISAGILISAVNGAAGLIKNRQNNFDLLRKSLAHSIILGLEFLVAADIIKTVAVDTSYSKIGILVIIILIRTFLSFTLEVETTGKWPWQQNK